MDGKKHKKSPDASSKSPRISRDHSDRTGKHHSSGSKAKADRSRSRSRSRSREHKHKHYDSPDRRHSPERRDRSSPRHRSGYRSTRYHSRSPSDRRRYDSFQEKTSRVLGVFGLSLYTDERVLREVFTQYGPVEDIRLILDHHSGESRGFGFVYMKYLQDAIQAKELIPGTEIDGRTIRVDYSFTDLSRNSSNAGNARQPAYNSSGAYRSTYRSPVSSSTRDHLYGNGSRGRSRSYSPRRF